MSDTILTISWTAPANNNYAITAYRVKLEDSSGTGHEDTAECDGSDSNIFDNLSCTFSMSTLQAAPYSLSIGADIIATVEAANVFGYGSASVDSNGSVKV